MSKHRVIVELDTWAGRGITQTEIIYAFEEAAQKLGTYLSIDVQEIREVPNEEVVLVGRVI
jgi:hypothetical protein